MKKIIVFALFLMSTLSYAQIDSLQLKKESRFKIAGRILKNNILSIPSDFSEMGHTFSNDWKKTATYAGGILGLIAIDKYTTGFLHDHIEPTIDYKIPSLQLINSDFEWFHGNNGYVTYSLTGLYLGSFILKNEKGQIAATNTFKAMAYSYVITHLALKTLFARNRPQRPNDPITSDTNVWTRNPWDFGNFHPVYFRSRANGTAFPSLHATAYFTVAKVLQMEYDNYWIPYTLVTGLFFAEMKSHNHWVSDLVLGGIIGTIIGRSVVKSSRKIKAKNDSKLSKISSKKIKLEKKLIPQISNSIIGLHFSATF